MGIGLETKTLFSVSAQVAAPAMELRRDTVFELPQIGRGIISRYGVIEALDRFRELLGRSERPCDEHRSFKGPCA